jgi:hypothetical protein
MQTKHKNIQLQNHIYVLKVGHAVAYSLKWRQYPKRGAKTRSQTTCFGSLALSTLTSRTRQLVVLMWRHGNERRHGNETFSNGLYLKSIFNGGKQRLWFDVRFPTNLEKQTLINWEIFRNTKNCNKIKDMIQIIKLIWKIKIDNMLERW